MLVSDLLGMDRPKVGEVGIELEVEALTPLPIINEKGWRTKEDPSLRYHALEYVTARPIKCDDKKLERIRYLTDKVNQSAVNQGSPRTSLHVHVNVSDLQPIQVWTAITGYWLLDNLLMQYCDDELRSGNCFCLRLKDAEYLLHACQEDLKEVAPFQSLQVDRLRYASQNLKAIGDFGSLEYRGMRGTTDPDVIHEWSNNLFKLSRACQQYSNPQELVEQYFRTDKETWLHKFFDVALVEKLIAFNGWQGLIAENEGSICELAYTVEWDKWNKRIQAGNALPKPPARNARPRAIHLNQINHELPPIPQEARVNWAVMDDFGNLVEEAG